MNAQKLCYSVNESHKRLFKQKMIRVHGHVFHISKNILKVSKACTKIRDIKRSCKLNGTEK